MRSEKEPLKLCPVARTRLTERTVVPRAELGKAEGVAATLALR